MDSMVEISVMVDHYDNVDSGHLGELTDRSNLVSSATLGRETRYLLLVVVGLYI
jgi:hypothetical protein